MNFGTLAAPTLTPGTGSYTSQAVVTITALCGRHDSLHDQWLAVTPSSPIYTDPLDRDRARRR